MRRLDDPAQLEGKSARDESVNANHFQDTFLFLRSPLNHTTRKFLASIAAKSSLDSAWAGFGCRACFVAFFSRSTILQISIRLFSNEHIQSTSCHLSPTLRHSVYFGCKGTNLIHKQKLDGARVSIDFALWISEPQPCSLLRLEQLAPVGCTFQQHSVVTAR